MTPGRGHDVEILSNIQPACYRMNPPRPVSGAYVGHTTPVRILARRVYHMSRGLRLGPCPCVLLAVPLI